MKNTFSKFLYLFNHREKLQILALLFLILTGALLETVVVGIFYPYISMLKTPEIIYEHKMLRWIYSNIGFTSTKEFLIFASAGLIFSYLLKNVYQVFLIFVQARFVFSKQMSFSRALFSTYMQLPYTFHLQRNTAEILHKINVVVPVLFSGVLLQTIMFIVEIITMISILCLLIVIKPLLSILAVGMLGIATFAFYRVTRKKISEFGKLKQHHGEQMMQWVNQGLGGIKETKILGREDFFSNAYNRNCNGYAHAERFIHLISQIPRPFLETICIISMLSITLLIITQNKDVQSIIPTLSLFAVAAFRIIPSMGRIFSSATVIRYNSYSLDLVYKDLTLLDEYSNSQKNVVTGSTTNAAVDSERTADSYGHQGVSFENAIELIEVCYRYPNAKKLSLNGVSLTIPKHSSIGFVGPTGAGKTTIVDIIIGLLEPVKGEVLVDGKNIRDNLPSWQRKIGYIPQNIYLSDDTIRRNIAFGLPDEQIDEDWVWSSLESAQLAELVNSLPGRLDTFVGERGVRLSGGQRQRIGIARALYHNPEVLVMDEGTASLDNETEWEIMQAMNRLSGKKTLIIIAHRLSTVKNCDQLYFMREGEVVNYGTYEELFDKSQEFKSMVMATEHKG